MSDRWRNIANVIRREYVERVRDRGFLISTGFVVVVVLLITVLPRLLGADDTPSYDVGVTGQQSARLAAALPAAGRAAGVELRVSTQPGEAAATAAVQDERLDLAVVDGRRVIALGTPPASVLAVVQATTSQLRLASVLTDAGLSADQTRGALSPAPLAVTSLTPPADEARMAVARFGSFLLYLQLLTYGYWVAAGVVEEKSSRVVELLLAAIRPAHLLAGKVIGIGLLGLTQLVVLAGVGLAAVTVFDVVDLPLELTPTILSVLAWFLLGFAFWAGAFAVAGAIVSRQEELQNSTGPLTLVMVAGFMVAIAAGNDPGSVLARVASFIPPVAPLVVPLRMAAGEMGGLEVAAAVAVSVAATVALIPLAARIYAGAVLRTGGRVKLSTAFRSS